MRPCLGPTAPPGVRFSVPSALFTLSGIWNIRDRPCSCKLTTQCAHGAGAYAPCPPAAGAGEVCLRSHNLRCLHSRPKAIVAVGFSVSMTTTRGWLLPKVAMATIRGESCLGCFGWLFHE